MFKSPALQIKPFRLLLIGQLVSFFGDTLYYVLFAFMVQKISGSVAMVGFIGAAESLPFLLLSAYAGVVADKFDRKKIMLYADLVPCVILMLFATVIFFMERPPLWLLFIVAPSLSIATAFMWPARSASMPRLVPKENLLEANALFSMFRNIVPMASLALSATILGWLWGISEKWFFLTAVLVNAVTFLISAVYTSRLPSILPEKTEDKHPLTDFVEGIRYLKSRGELLMLLFLSASTSLIFAPFFVTYVKANNDWFGGKPGTLALFELAFFGGVVISSMVVGKLKIVRVGVSFIWGVAFVGATIAAMAYSRTVSLFAFWNFMAGLAMPFFQIPMNTYSQMTVPDGFRGRVNSCFNMVGMGVMPIGQALGGALIQTVGLVKAFMAMGLASIASSLTGFASKPFRNAVLPDRAPVVTVDSEAAEADDIVDGVLAPDPA